MIFPEKNSSYLHGLATVAALAFVLLLQGTVPYWLTPTLGQAVWTVGFSQSFVNESLTSIYASNFGAPAPASIPFGLAAAWPIGVLLRLGLSAPDAYSWIFAGWLSVAFFGAYFCAKQIVTERSVALGGALIWMTLPILWGHAGYSMVSLGFSLLPLYFVASLNLFGVTSIDNAVNERSITFSASLAFWLVCVLAVFMDGYSFVMFAVGSAVFGFWLFVFRPISRQLLLRALPVCLAGLAIAYGLYTLYIGQMGFTPAPLSFFRAYGVDVSFLFVPTAGEHWLADLLGVSVSRSAAEYFGDSSVWRTTFSGLLICGAALAIARLRKMPLALCFSFVCLIGFYMSLGPSLKLDSKKPASIAHEVMMDGQYAVAPTGSSLLSSNVPGFSSMRASYRWIALGSFGAWSVLILLLARERSIARGITIGFCVLLVLVNLPDLSRKIDADMQNRAMFLQLKQDFVGQLSQHVSKGDRVAFLPWANDFLANYSAAEIGFTTFNIGGDKNLNIARKHWPQTMLAFSHGRIGPDFTEKVLLLLASGEADVVILPFIDMLWAAHKWPAPLVLEPKLKNPIRKLRGSELVSVEASPLFAAVRLSELAKSISKTNDLELLVLEDVCLPPACLEQLEFDSSTPSQVGILAGPALTSSSARGFLIFGPYVQMSEGEYRLTVRGSGVTSGAWVDVVSQLGAVVHGQVSLGVDIQRGDVLAETIIRIEQPVDDLEVRVFVNESDQLIVTSYDLTPVK